MRQAFRARPFRPFRLILPALLGSTALAGGSSESVLLLVDPGSAEALHLANHYRAARDVPASNLLFLEPVATNYAAFVEVQQSALFGALAGRGIGHVDYVLVMPGSGFFTPAPGLVSDGCSPVTRFSVGAPFTLAFQSGVVQGGVPVSRANRYYSTSNEALAFDSSISWFGGQPSTAINAERYFLGAMLGYTGLRGNSRQEILDLIDRSVASDGIGPAGTFYFMQTTDQARSAPRHGAYPAVSATIVALGGSAQHLFADLPLGQHDCQGIMTGLANPPILGGDFSLLPGSFADHLTSYAGTFDNGSQTKMSEWISKGASGTCGTVEEPCNYAGKFPHARMHLYVHQGLPLGDAWLRSLSFYPFQNLFYGDPLARPFARIPTVEVPDPPARPVSGSVLLHPIASGAPGQVLHELELYVDGVLARTGSLGQPLALQTDHLDDGWHELRVLAYDTTGVRNVGRWIGSVLVQNAGRSATLGVGTSSGDQDTLFDFALEAPGQQPIELRLVSSDRVLAATAANPGVVTLSGANLGAGPVRVQAEALFAGGSRVRSAPVELSVSPTDSQPPSAPPLAFSFHKLVPAASTTVVELPAFFEDDPSAVAFSVTSAPAQAAFLGSTTRGYRVLRPLPGASGTDSMVFTVQSPSGVSAPATVTLVYSSTACPTPQSYCIGAPNSAGPGAAIAAVGSTSVAANQLRLQVAGATPTQPGLVYYGPAQVQLPFGDGFRCVAGGGIGTFRLPIVITGPGGTLDLALDLNQPPALSGPGEIAPGDRWNFQHWFRDPAAGQSGFNLSNAVSVEFCP